MRFLFPTLTWGFLLVLVPLAIHLINLIRQRRVEWAAMEFLLQAHRKHRHWIWLKQLLLLLLRMFIIAAIVAMLAQLLTTRQWLRLFQRSTTHHLVLLDDSFSMSDRSPREAFQRGVQAIQALARTAISQETAQRMSLILF
ncbi:MAG TPA: BatA domain-containing protein, partial [Pirellulaceae bacterium]